MPSLYDLEEYEKVIIASRPLAKQAGIPEGDRDAIFSHFISHVRSNLHIVLSMSPAGEAFRWVRDGRSAGRRVRAGGGGSRGDNINHNTRVNT